MGHLEQYFGEIGDKRSSLEFTWNYCIQQIFELILNSGPAYRQAGPEFKFCDLVFEHCNLFGICHLKIRISL